MRCSWVRVRYEADSFGEMVEVDTGLPAFHLFIRYGLTGFFTKIIWSQKTSYGAFGSKVLRLFCRI